MASFEAATLSHRCGGSLWTTTIASLIGADRKIRHMKDSNDEKAIAEARTAFQLRSQRLEAFPTLIWSAPISDRTVGVVALANSC